MKNIAPTKHYSSTLHQLCKLIPSHETEKLARKHGVDKKARTFTPWSYVVSLLFAQLSHANKHRNSDKMEGLFWQVLGHLQELSPGFGPAGRYDGLPRGFKRAIHAVDSTTIALVANCMDWAKHRRRKAAAKMHLRLNLQSFLPAFAIRHLLGHTRAKDNLRYHVCRKRLRKPSGKILCD